MIKFKHYKSKIIKLYNLQAGIGDMVRSLLANSRETFSPMDSAYFSCRSGGWDWEKFFPKIFFLFFCFQNLDALYRPVAGKPFVLEDLCFGMGTSVSSALTAETIFEIIKCVSDVDMGSKCEIFMFSSSGYAHERNMSIFRRRASKVTGKTLIKPNYASVRQSRDSLHRGTHNMTKKSRNRLS